MEPKKQVARTAGLLYLAMAVVGPFSLMYVPNKLIVSGNAGATSANVLAHEMLFRAGIVADIVGGVVFLLTALALYRLLAGVNKMQAATMVTLVGIAVAMGFLNEVMNLGALALFRGGEFLSVFTRPQLDALGMLFLRLHSQGNFVSEMFWGLWLLPFGTLVMRSGFLPRLLGVLLIVNGVGYVVCCFTWMLLPDYGRVVFLALQPALLGEIWIMLWLLIKGVRTPQTYAARAA